MENRILTEEELQEKQRAFKTGVMPTWEFDQIINSHRELFKANAGLSYEKMKYKEALARISSFGYGKQKEIADTALEEPK